MSINFSRLWVDPTKAGQVFSDDTYYQILYVEHFPNPSQNKYKKITTSVLAKTRKYESNNDQTSNNTQIQSVNLPKPSNNTHPQSFNLFKLDEETVKNLENYPRGDKDPKDELSSYLPSSGVVFPKELIDSFKDQQIDQETKQIDQQIQLGNFYVPMRTLLHSRKLSQLIAKTWWSYLKVKDTDLWDKFTNGEWDDIDSNILDGLIAREIFLYGGADSPDNPDPDDLSIYSPLKPKVYPSKNARFLILPSSRAWQGISLSLLLAGQAYYKREGKYHQISQPILSTGEITTQYSLEVDWNRFNGDIKEIVISHEKPWVAYQVVIPYPPIPPHADPEEIRQWAYAKEEYSEEDPKEEQNFPFYQKDAGNYLIDVDYFRPPYPYIPLTCS